MMNKDNRNDKIRKIAKKGLTFSLCAVLAGGLAAGSFEGVNKLAGWSGAMWSPQDFYLPDNRLHRLLQKLLPQE